MMIGANTRVSSPSSEGRASNDNRHWLLTPSISTGLATIGEDPHRKAPTSPREGHVGGELQSLRGALSHNIQAISMLQVQMAAIEASTAELRKQLNALQGAARAAGDLQTGANARANAGVGRPPFRVAEAESNASNSHIGRVYEEFFERAVAHTNRVVAELRSEMSKESAGRVASVMEHTDASVSLLRCELRRYIAEFRRTFDSKAVGGGASAPRGQNNPGPLQHEPCAAPAGGATPPMANTRKTSGPGKVAIPQVFQQQSAQAPSRPDVANGEFKETLSGLDRSIRVLLKEPSTPGLSRRSVGEIPKTAALGPPALPAAADGAGVSGHLHDPHSGPANPIMARGSIPSLATASSSSYQHLQYGSSSSQWQPHQSSDTRPVYTSIAPGSQSRDRLNSPR